MKLPLFIATTLYTLATTLLVAQTNRIHDPNKQILPIGGNAWVSGGGTITDLGLEDWSDPNSVCTAYFRVAQKGKLNISLVLDTKNKETTLNVTIFGKTIPIPVKSENQNEYFVGEWSVNQPGYIPIKIQGISKSGLTFGHLSGIGISGTTISGEVSFVKDNQDNYFYWGRRGPSVHLNFNTAEKKNIEWFYSEITVPRKNDVLGSYFMANGFKQGYFGIQVNSETERRILFSVWSPYETDDPTTIPDGYKITMLKKGENVYTGEFGNEGSGGQSYLKFDWKAGTTYGFLLKGEPDGKDATVYTAWFFAPEENKWRLIASFKRPHTSSYLTNLHSFLENFEPETGNQSRMAIYGNQWIADPRGQWSELSDMSFSGDNTARKNFRKDYAGGVYKKQFYLKNGGFFNEYTKLGEKFKRNPRGKKPKIDFSKLP